MKKVLRAGVKVAGQISDRIYTILASLASHMTSRATTLAAVYILAVVGDAVKSEWLKKGLEDFSRTIF